MKINNLTKPRRHSTTFAKPTLTTIRMKVTYFTLKLNQIEQAKEKFEALVDYYPSFEVIFYYLQTLINWNEINKANQVLQIIDHRLKHLHKHVKKLNSQWIRKINQSRQKLSQINR